MTQIKVKFNKVLGLPSTLESNSFYITEDGDNCEIVLTDQEAAPKNLVALAKWANLIGKPEIVNNLLETEAGKFLDARQGKILKDLINANVGGGFTQEQIEDIVGAMIQTGSNMSFNYNDLTGKLEIDAIDISQEEIEDRIGALISAGANTTVTYNDAGNTLVIAETAAGKTAEEIQDIVNALLLQGSNVTLTYDDVANTLTVAATGGGSGGAVSSVNGQTGAVVIHADNVSDAGTTNRFSSTSEKDKLGLISVTQPIDLDALESGGGSYDSVVNYASLAAAVTAIGATRKTLLVPTDQVVSTAIVVPPTLEILRINGAKISFTGAGSIEFQGLGILNLNSPLPLFVLPVPEYAASTYDYNLAKRVFWASGNVNPPKQVSTEIFEIDANTSLSDRLFYLTRAFQGVRTRFDLHPKNINRSVAFYDDHSLYATKGDFSNNIVHTNNQDNAPFILGDNCLFDGDKGAVIYDSINDDSHFLIYTKEGAKNVTIQNLHLKGNKTGKNFSGKDSTVFLINAKNSHILNMYFEGCRAYHAFIGGSGASASGANNKDCSIQDCISDGYLSQLVAASHGEGHLIKNNRILLKGLSGDSSFVPIDIEPNTTSDVIKHLTLESNFVDVRGLVPNSAGVQAYCAAGIAIQGVGQTENVRLINNEVIGQDIDDSSGTTGTLQRGVYAFGVNGLYHEANKVTGAYQSDMDIFLCRNVTERGDLLTQSQGSNGTVRIAGVADSKFIGVLMEKTRAVVGQLANIKESEIDIAVTASGSVVTQSGGGLLRFYSWFKDLKFLVNNTLHTVATVSPLTSPQTMTTVAAVGTLANKTFVAADVNTADNKITIANHPYLTGARVGYEKEGTGTVVGGLINGNLYDVLVVDANTIQLKDVSTGAIKDLTSAGTGTQTFGFILTTRFSNNKYVGNKVPDGITREPTGRSVIYSTFESQENDNRNAEIVAFTKIGRNRTSEITNEPSSYDAFPSVCVYGDKIFKFHKQGSSHTAPGFIRLNKSTDGGSSWTGYKNITIGGVPVEDGESVNSGVSLDGRIVISLTRAVDNYANIHFAYSDNDGEDFIQASIVDFPSPTVRGASHGKICTFKSGNMMDAAFAYSGDGTSGTIYKTFFLKTFNKGVTWDWYSEILNGINGGGIFSDHGAVTEPYFCITQDNGIDEEAHLLIAVRNDNNVYHYQLSSVNGGLTCTNDSQVQGFLMFDEDNTGAGYAAPVSFQVVGKYVYLVIGYRGGGLYHKHEIRVYKKLITQVFGNPNGWGKYSVIYNAITGWRVGSHNNSTYPEIFVTASGEVKIVYYDIPIEQIPYSSTETDRTKISCMAVDHLYRFEARAKVNNDPVTTADNQTINSNVKTKVNLDLIWINTDGLYDKTTAKIKIPEYGNYCFNAQIQFSPSTTGTYIKLIIEKVDVGAAASLSMPNQVAMARKLIDKKVLPPHASLDEFNFLSLSKTVECYAGEIIEIYVEHNSTNNLEIVNINPDTRAKLSIQGINI